MVNDSTPIRDVFINLLAKLTQKGILSVGDVKEILEATDEDLIDALENVLKELKRDVIIIGNERYVRDSDGQGWHALKDEGGEANEIQSN